MSNCIIRYMNIYKYIIIYILICLFITIYLSFMCVLTSVINIHTVFAAYVKLNNLRKSKRVETEECLNNEKK